MGWIQPVADAPHRDEMDRPVRLLLDLRSKPADMDVNRAWITDLVEAPDTIEELPPGKRPAGMGGEHRQQLKFLWPQVHGAAVPTQLVGDQVELEAVSDFDADAHPGARLLLEQRGPSRELARVD